PRQHPHITPFPYTTLFRSPDLVDKEQPEHEAQEAGGEPQVSVDPREPPGRIQEGRRDRDGDQHHSDDGSDSEEQEVRDGPPGSLDRKSTRLNSSHVSISYA